MPVVTEEHRAAQRARIHAATFEVLRRKGLSGLAMSDIIAASGMSAGAIYGYFKGKDDLVYSLAETTIGGRVDALRQAADDRPVPPPEEAFRRIFDGLQPNLVADGIILQIWAEAVTHPRIRMLAQRGIADFYDATGDYVAAWLSHQRGVPAAEARRRGMASAPAMVALAQGFIVQGSVLDDFVAETYLSAIRSLAEALVTASSTPPESVG